MADRKEFLVFGSPLIQEEEIQEVVSSMRSGWIGTGPKVGRFEAMFKEYIGCRHALALNSCTAALHLSLIAAGVGQGDLVITTPMTFAATANAIIHTGATPVFVDVERDTMNIDPEKIEDKIKALKVKGSRIKAILPVHFAGRPCNMNAIKAICKKHNIFLIEDAAHAIESVYHSEKIGTIGDLTCFSFYVTKNIITGEGGMVTTGNDEYAKKIQNYGLHGMSKGAWKRYGDEGFKHYQIIYPGFKYNMMDLQAAIGIHQLPRIKRYLIRREEIWERYNQAFQDLRVILPSEPEKGTIHSRHLYTLLLDIDSLTVDRDVIQQTLHELNIGTGIHYIAIHLHPYYAKTFRYKIGNFPNAEFISDRTISLPLSPKLIDKDVEDVIGAVNQVLTYYKK